MAKKIETGTTSVVIPPIKRQTVHLKLVGISPLITHAWSPKAIKMMRDKQMKKAKSKREAKDPKAEFEAARYRMDDGQDGIRADGIKKAMVDACSFVEGITKVLSRGAFYVNPGDALVPIFTPDGKRYGIDVEPLMREDLVRVGSRGPGTGTADLRYRPEYTQWMVPIRVVYNANVVSVDQIVNLLSLAGFSVGLAEGRPQLQGGQWGMFEIIGAEPVAEAAE